MSTQATFILLDFYNVLYFPKSEELNATLIDFIKHNTQYRYGVLSAVDIDLERWLESHSLLGYFEFVKTTHQLQASKTEPDTYTMIANALSLQPEEIVFCDDLQQNVAAAKTAGLRTVLFRPKTKLEDEIL